MDRVGQLGCLLMWGHPLAHQFSCYWHLSTTSHTPRRTAGIQEAHTRFCLWLLISRWSKFRELKKSKEKIQHIFSSSSPSFFPSSFFSLYIPVFTNPEAWNIPVSLPLVSPLLTFSQAWDLHTHPHTHSRSQNIPVSVSVILFHACLACSPSGGQRSAASPAAHI